MIIAVPADQLSAADGRPQPGEVPGSIDTQDDYFRIRLICTLLDACGQYFDRGQLRKRMDNFLTFFQLYVRTKRQPLPMDVDFMLTDSLEVCGSYIVRSAIFAR